jgi:ABC-type glycerol-3-phosphate transport system permease component
VADAGDLPAIVPVLHRGDPATGGKLMATLQGVGSRRSKMLFAGSVYLGLVAMTAVFLFPLLWVVGLSLKTRLQVFATPPLFVWWPTLENYAGVLGQADFLQAFVNSLVVSAGAVLLSLCVGVPAAYAFARFPFRGGSFLFFSLLVMRMLPPIAVLVPMYVLFSKLGLTTTRFSVVLAYSTFSLPLVVWIMRGFFEDLPRELEESAWVDGASRAAAFRHVVLPLIRPGLVAASILCLQLAWNDFLFAAVLTNNATRTLPVLMAGYSGGDTGVDWGGMTASGALVILPVLIFSFAAQRHLVAGLSSGAVKG